MFFPIKEIFILVFAWNIQESIGLSAQDPTCCHTQGIYYSIFYSLIKETWQLFPKSYNYLYHTKTRYSFTQEHISGVNIAFKKILQAEMLYIRQYYRRKYGISITLMRIISGDSDEIADIFPKFARKSSSESQLWEKIGNLMIPVDEDLLKYPPQIALLFWRA